MAKYIDFHFRVAILLSLLTRLVQGRCDDTAIGLQHRGRVYDARFSASSKYDANTPAPNGRLEYTGGSSWCASSSDSTPYLQVDLGSVYIICGMATQGNSQSDQWVSTYQVQYSNSNSWIDYRENGIVKIFQGNYDRSTVVKRFLYDGVQTQYIRVLPKSHYNRVCLRLELYGVTKQACSTTEVGVSTSAKVPDYRFSASSTFDRDFYAPSFARLNNRQKPGWAPTEKGKSNSWLKIDLGDAFVVCGIATQGTSKRVTQEWPKKYKLRLSMDNVTWQYYQENGATKVFPGNSNNHQIVRNNLNHGSPAKLIEVWPTESENFPTLRMELYGVPQGCRSSLGIERGSVLDSQLTASSGTGSDGRLYNSGTAWCSATKSNTEYLQVDLKGSVTLTGITTQGHPTRQEWIETFNIKYSFNKSEWFDFKDGESFVKSFASVDGKLKTSWFKHPFVARYVRIYPQTWQQRPCLRFDLYGCNNVNSPKVSVQGAMSTSGSGTNTKVTVALECRANGQPTPEIKWRDGATDFTSIARILTQSNGFTNSSLTLQVPLSQLTSQFSCQPHSSRVVTCSWQSYKCVASYPEVHGGARSLKQIRLSVDLNVPAAVTNLRASVVKVRSVVLSWNTPDPGSAQITSYNLEYWGAPNYKNINIMGNVNSYEVLGLTPYTDYTPTFYLKAVSDLGEGPRIRIAPHFRTKQAAPFKPQYSRHTLDPSVPRLTLYWWPPSVKNGVITKYTLYYRYLPDGNVTIVTMGSKSGSTTVNVIGGLKFNFSLSATTVDEGPKWSRLILIPEYKPEAAPTNFKFRHVNASIYNCSWTPPPREKSHGKIVSYDVKYSGKTLRRKKRSIKATIVKTKTPYALLEDLKVCNIYNVSVRASTSKGPGPYSEALPIENAAAPPNDFKATETDKVFVIIKWKEPAKLGSSIQGYKVKYEGRKPYDGNFYQSEVVDIDSRLTTIKKITGLFPATDYELRVATKAGCRTLTYTDKIRVTTKIDNPVRPNITKVQQYDGTNTTVTVTISPSSPRNGPISLYQIIVLRSSNEEKLPKDFEAKLKGYKESKAVNENFYIAFEIPARNVTANSRFTVGDGKMYGSYHNAKLQEGEKYVIFVRAISKENKATFAGEYSMVARVSVRKESTGSPGRKSTTAVVAGVVSACLIVALIIIVVVIVRRKRKKDSSKTDSSESMKLKGLAVQPLAHSNDNLDSEDELEGNRVPQAAVSVRPSAPELPTKITNNGIMNVGKGVLPSAPDIPEPVVYSNAIEEGHHKPIPVVQFSEYMNRVKGANYARLRQEYNALPKSKQFPWTVAEKPDNKKLNRFANIMAYDHSRVPVEPAGGVEYINANFIEGWDGTPKVYIATQGPNPSTFSIFWLMVWNERVGTIVMVTNIVENGKTKCQQYWPENTAKYGAVKISLHKVEAFADFTIRTLILSKNSQTRTVCQFHFTVWPDHGVPRLPTNILSLRRRVRSRTKQDTGPVLVHCSAGVGRTGTYIVIDAMLERAKTQKNVDIHSYMHVVRRDRIHMVQTEDQYVFLHKAILESLTCGNTEINPQDIQHVMKKLAAASGPQGKTGYVVEFERLGFVCPNPGRDECETAFKPMNLSKNRVQELAPLDISRVLLLRPVVNEGDDYISASFADAYKERNTFIMTQAPLPHTIEDFWQMVFDYSIGSVVMLNSLKEDGQTYPKYWPEEGSSEETYGDMKVTLSSEKNLGEIVLRKLTVQDKKLNRAPQSVHHLQHTAWPNHSVPKNKQSILDLVTRVTTALQQSGNTSFVVLCSDGVGRSGSFCTIYSTLERVKLEQIVDVFQACKVVRARRPAAVENLEQYKLCYEIVQEFLDSFSEYSNFNDM